MPLERFPKRVLLRKLDDVEFTLTHWFRESANAELTAMTPAEGDECHQEALQLDKLITKVRELRLDLRLLELP